MSASPRRASREYLKAELANPQSPIHGRKPVVILGYDTRFLGREFSLAAAEVLAANGLTPLLCDRDTPTPVIAHTIRPRKALGGINMTASHNPAEYQGLKFSTYNGAPGHAGSDQTNRGQHRASCSRRKLELSRRRSSALISARPSIRSRIISNNCTS